MKSKEEIEQLAEQSNAERGIDSAKSMLEREYVLGYTTAYTQCQKDNEAEENRLKKIIFTHHQSMSLAEEKARNYDNKYTEEDIRNAIREGRNSIHFENDGSWWEDKTVEEDFIKQLNNDTKDDDLNFLSNNDLI